MITKQLKLSQLKPHVGNARRKGAYRKADL